MVPGMSRPKVLLVDDNAELLQLLARLFEADGWTPVVASKGRQAIDLVGLERPQVAVVDVLLPDMMGFDVAAALREAKVPFVFMTGVFKGGRAATEARVQHGAAAYFEKPFAVEALLDALGPLLGVKPGREPGPVRDEVTDAEPVEDENAPAPAGRRRRGAAPAPLGDLSTTRVPRLVVACHTAQVTGALTLQRGAVKRLVLFRQGIPVFASSNLAADRFGALCVRRGVITQPQREALMRELGPEGRTADALLGKGLLTEKRRVELVAEQVRSIIWSTFPWREGAWRLEVKPLPPRELVQLSLFPGDLILEGVLRTATLEELRRDLPAEVALAPAPDPAFELYALGLRPVEAHLLAAADGTKTVTDLLRLSDLPEREAMAFLYACRIMGVLDEVERVLAGTRRMAFM